VESIESDMLSERSEMSVNDFFQSAESNLSYNQKQTNFTILGKISEDKKIEIIQTGFRLNQEGKISLKNYYEGTGEYMLFE